MGTVFCAEDPLINRTVAVKVLHASREMAPDLVQISRERFRREAQAAASIDHPNVIRIYDFGEEAESGEMYIVMEYVSGSSLEAMLERSSLPLESAVRIIGQLAAGLDAAHAKRIIHRDIKPSNILVANDGTAKLADFGITHVASSSLTQDMRVLGTPAYTSPEQVNGKALDSRADLFSLGVLSYEILAGRKPFDGNDPISIAYAIVHSQPVPISVANPALPKSLDPVLERMLAKDPGDRFTSGREFHEALAASLADVPAARPRAAAMASKSRGNRWYWGLAAAAMLAIAAIGLSASPDPIPDPGVAKQAVAKPAEAAVKPAEAVGKPAETVATPPAKAIVTQPKKPAASATTPPRPRPLPAVPPSGVAVSLSHRIRNGTLVVELDGVPVFNERFTKDKLAISQTTSWDAFRAPSGKHKLKASVMTEDGKTYLSDLHIVDLPGAKNAIVRIGFKGDKLTIKQSPG
jgi:serine/threonine-protein kinase